MEVHSHTHTARKKWTHYLWEFLMLFLAVFCGFLAENTREHLVERKKDKEFVRSIVNDLKTDTAWLTGFLDNQRLSMSAFDSVIILLNQDKRSEFDQQRLYYLVRIGMRYSDFYKSNETAYEQMKNSGNLRLIHRQDIANRIAKYYFDAKEATLNKDQTLLRQQSMLDFEGKIFDGYVFQDMINKGQFGIEAPSGSLALMTEDRKLINEFIVRVHYLFSIMLFSKTVAIEQTEKAKSLMEFLQHEYRIE